jgi:hypothetical protein
MSNALPNRTIPSNIKAPYSGEIYQKEISKDEGDTHRDKKGFDERSQDGSFLRRDILPRPKFKDDNEEEDKEAGGQGIGDSF